MVSALLDTSVVVDLLRKHPPALTWLKGQSSLSLSAIVWLEVLEGVQNRRARALAVRTLKDFERVDPIKADFDWAVARILQFRLSHGVDAFDCLIASASYRLQLPLYTSNLKHFAPLLGDLAQEPY